MKNVLVITNLFPNSKDSTRGIFNKQQFLELAKLCDLKVMAPVPWHKANGIESKEYIDGIEAYHPRYFMIPKVLRSLYGIFMFFGIKNVAKKLESESNFDAILATWAYPDGFAAALLAKLLKKPLVIKVHGSDINLHTGTFIRRQFIRYALNASDKVIAVTEALKRSIAGLGILSSKIEVIQNGVDSELFRPVDTGKRRKTILFAGNLVPVKGVRYLIEAFAALARRDPQLELIIVGDGPQSRLLKEKCKALGISDSVKFTGRISHNDMPLWFNRADLFCLPSINEGCPNVALEALACGKPVVASRVGGLPEIINDENGILVEPENVSKLVDALSKALDKEWDTDKIRRSSLRFSWKESAGKLNLALGYSVKTHVSWKRGDGLKNSIKRFIDYVAPKSIILWRSRPRANEVALTFDDGPNANFTPRVLDILKEKNTRATFFLIGKEARQEKELVSRILNEGHSIGMHSYSHYRFGRLNTGGRKEEIEKSKHIFEKEMGIRTKLFRPPQGSISLGQLLYCLKNDIVTVMWSVNSMDYLNKGLENIKSRFAGNGIRSGDIILFHDDNEFTVNALSEIIDGLREKNLDFVTVEEMLK